MTESMELPYSKKRRTGNLGDVSVMPVLNSKDYFTIPSLHDMRAMELENPGYLKRVCNFVVGRVGYGRVKFLGETDVRSLELDRLVKFRRHEIVVYGNVETNEVREPPVGEGLNKAAEVTLKIRVRCGSRCGESLKRFTEQQGARFIEFDNVNKEWRFAVMHFSRFGLTEEEEDDISMDDAVEDPDANPNGARVPNNECVEQSDVDVDMNIAETAAEEEPLLLHSLPAHLRLDPVKMNEMRMILFSGDEEEPEEREGSADISSRKMINGRDNFKYHSKNPFSYQSIREASPPGLRKMPLALLEYNPIGSNSGSRENYLMSQQNKGLVLKNVKRVGFELELKNDTPISRSHSRNIVDAGLFMGRSFRVGWGPNGILIHSGIPVGSNSPKHSISSVLQVEKVAFDKAVRDRSSKLNEELIDSAFEAPLNLHHSLNHEEKEIMFGTFKLKLRKSVFSRLVLAETSRSYISIIEKHLEAPVPNPMRLLLMHQVMMWELIKVLFSERQNNEQSTSVSADNEDDMIQETKENPSDVDVEALPLVRRAEFSCWLQESVYHRVQEDVSCVDASNHLVHILLLLTGRQLDSAVELAASKGDVRLACLLSQAGCSTINRAYLSRQLNLWRMNGLDFSFIEKERIRLYELLSGNIFDALLDIEIDWKRFLGLLMWYRLAPDLSLPRIFETYRDLLDEGKVPFPLPIYLDEAYEEEEEPVKLSTRRCDFSYYLMLLHAEVEGNLSFLKTMFSALSSTPDPLDYHMIWHQRAVLEGVSVFSSADLHVLDMGYVSQLLSVGKIHWAIYVVLHIPFREDFPYLHGNIIREILFQHCETWNSDESQRRFIENLGIPAEWLHESLATFYSYRGDLLKALEHFIKCKKWRHAHSVFVTAVAHSLFLSGKDTEVWRLATSMEHHKSEIDGWDLGAGLYISFYALTGDAENAIERESLDERRRACEEFLVQVNDALRTQSKVATGARVAYAKMGRVISEMAAGLVSEWRDRDVQMNCFKKLLDSALPEGVKSNFLQDALSLFTCYLTEISS